MAASRAHTTKERAKRIRRKVKKVANGRPRLVDLPFGERTSRAQVIDDKKPA